MPLYVNCFYDFQETCIPHQCSLTSHKRRSRDLNFETENSSKSPKLENLQIMPKCFYKFWKNVITTSKLKLCEFSAFFILAYVVSHLQIQQTKRTLN